MPVETVKTVTATSPLSDADLLHELKAFAQEKIDALPLRGGQVVRVKDPSPFPPIVQLLRPVGVVISMTVDGSAQVVFHSVDGIEMILSVMPGQLEVVS